MRPWRQYLQDALTKSPQDELLTSVKYEGQISAKVGGQANLAA